MRHTLIYNSINLGDFGVYVSGEHSWAKPAPEFEKVSVPGRSGDLITYNGKYSNVDIVYRLGITKDFDENFTALVSALFADPGYHRLEDTHHPGEYRMAMIEETIEPEMTWRNVAGQFDVKFNCKPQIYLTDGEMQFTYEQDLFVAESLTVNLFNPTSFDAFPLLRLYGDGTVTINGEIITVSGNSVYTDIDCDLQDAYYGAVNRNGIITLTTGDFPTLKPGVNTITLNGPSKLVVTPRWWRL